MDREYARTAEDVLWRRTKLGLRMGRDQVVALQAWMDAQRVHAAPAAE
jgi:glycerol-3-phosphate dehydrogenase